MTTPQTQVRLSNAEIVWNAAKELHNANRRITRAVIVQLTGLKTGIVDDHIERLICKDKLMRAGNGELEVLESAWPDRDMSLTVGSHGIAKIEVADAPMLSVTHSEARSLARLLAGFLGEAMHIDQGNRAMVLHHELAKELRAMRAENAALRKSLLSGSSCSSMQMELIESGRVVGVVEGKMKASQNALAPKSN